MKNKKGQAGMMIGIMVVLIIGIVIFQIIFTLIDDQTAQVSVVGDQFTATNGTCVQVTTNCMAPGSGIVSNESTGEVKTGNYTECTVNNPDKINGFVMNIEGGDPAFNGITVNASYTDRSCSFITGGTTTTVLNLLPLLFAVALLIFVAGFIALKK